MTPDEQRAEALCAKAIDQAVYNVLYGDDNGDTITTLKKHLADGLRDSLTAALRDERRRTLEEAATIAGSWCKGFDIAWWRETPKTDIYKQACLDIEQALREQARRGDK